MNGTVLYVIDWVIHLTAGGTEDRREIYQWEQRQEFIKRYLDLTGSDKWYASDIRCSIARTEPVDMDKLINSL